MLIAMTPLSWAPQFAIVLSWCITGIRGALYHRVTDLPTEQYDFIVVGGGTAGNVVANRLSVNPAWTVLVLEAGPSHLGVEALEVPFFCPSLGGTRFDSNVTTTPQVGLNGRVVTLSNGRVLGGSSSINYMVYTRGSSEDYDRWANLTGDIGWSWKKLLPYIDKNEKFVHSADFHNTSGQFNPKYHGVNGTNFVSLSGFPRSIDSRVIETTAQFPTEFPFNLDMNSGKHLGIGWTQSTIGDGRRSSSATSYLAPKYVNRRNLHVLLNAHVTRVLPTTPGNTPRDVRTVEFSQNGEGPRRKLTAFKELILSAGGIETPHILLNSGIGNASALTALGISPVINLPSVGKNYHDHPIIAHNFEVNSTETYDEFNAGRNASAAAQMLQQWQTSKTGPLVDALDSHIAWLRLPKNDSIFDEFSDPAAGPNTAHIELGISNGFKGVLPPSGNYISIFSAVVSPMSTGSITINSSNPFDSALINPGFLTSEFDLHTMRTGIRLAQKILTAPAWKDYVIRTMGDLANATTDTELNAYIRANTGSLNHPVGTAAMSKKGSKDGVVDPDLKLKGAKGLRIVDASILPRIPAAHPQAAVYLVAERAADLITSSWD